jgi:hypothetical protein
MKTPVEIRAIVDAHEQRYRLSCSPSLIELILKIEGRVRSDYYELQDKYKDQNVGLGVFEGQTIEGIAFHKHDPSKQGTFAERINAEWNRRQLFAAYTLNNGSATDYHGWIVADVAGDEVKLLSKYSECGNGEGKRTATSIIRISEAIPPRITDLLFYSPAKSAV